jgi:3-hydroxyacyl-[acyl-carrier-protein] dehydratase
MSLQSPDLVSLLPHRAPMLLLDRAQMRDDARLVAWQTIPTGHPALLGHFPDFPLWPGALLIEAMAQTTAVWLLYWRGALAVDEIPLLGSVDCQFRRPVLPGACLVFETRRLRERNGLGLFAVTASVDGGEVVARARIAAGIKPRSIITQRTE